MKKHAFKAESKKLLDLMVNSIYTNKDIFLRELISNSSDAIDKLYYMSLTDDNIEIDKEEFNIRVEYDKSNRTITITDNGIGMNDSELEQNLGTICESGSLLFKKENEKRDDIDVIGQFGVGFYSAFMVAKKIDVLSRKYGEKDAYLWSSEGADGYTITNSERSSWGTTITLYLKDDTDEEKYSDYLDEYKLRGIILKYSNYITYPIVMNVKKSREKEKDKGKYEDYFEDEVINSMIPIWKKQPSEVKEDEYNNFYTDTFYDYEKPLKVFRNNVEGLVNYTSLLFIPNHAPYDFYQKEYEKGLSLYSNGVLVMEKCGDLLPDYFNFVKGLVDSPDVSLNISREILQQDRQVKTIAKSIESKIKKELENMRDNDREKYVKFFETFGTQLKFGVYNEFGMHKEELKDLLMFYSMNEKKLITLKEYVENMSKDQDKIYYVAGETNEKLDMLPQIDSFKERKIDVLYLTDYIDEFAVQTLQKYDDKEFVNISSDNFDISTKEEKEKLEKENNNNKELLSELKEILKDNVTDVKFTDKLKNHPVCLTSKGVVSSNMEKIINAMPTDENIKSEKILEINKDHAIAKKIKELYKNDKKELENYAKILYAEARLIEGMSIDNPAELCDLICDIISK